MPKKTKIKLVGKPTPKVKVIVHEIDLRKEYQYEGFVHTQDIPQTPREKQVIGGNE